MPLKILKFLIFASIVAAILYVFHYNRAEVEVFYKDGVSFKGSMGLILTGSFLLGAVVCLLFSLLVGIKLQLRNWKTKKEKKQIEDHQNLIDEARGQLALGNFEKARSLFQKVISRDPTDIGARAFLARTFQEEGNLKKALQVLDQARAEDKKNTELLLLAADINASLGNHTAAYDNAAMVLKIVPKNRYALEKLTRDCVPLKRFDEAIEYQRQLIKQAAPSEVEQRQEQLAQLEMQYALSEHGDSSEQLEEELKQVLKRHRNYPPALDALAKIELASDKKKDAEKLWKKAFSQNAMVKYLAPIATMWLAVGEQERCLSSVRSAIDESKHSESMLILPRLFLVKLMIHLGHTEDAKTEFANIPDDNNDETIKRTKSIIKAKFLEKEGDLDSAFGELIALFESESAKPIDIDLSTASIQAEVSTPLEHRKTAA